MGNVNFLICRKCGWRASMPATSRISSCQMCDSYDVRRLRFEEFEWKAIVDWNREYWGVKEDLPIHADPDCQYCCGSGRTHGKPCPACVEPEPDDDWPYAHADLERVSELVREGQKAGAEAQKAVDLCPEDESDTAYVRASEFHDRMMKHVVERTVSNPGYKFHNPPADLRPGEGYCYRCGQRGGRKASSLLSDHGWYLANDYAPPAMVCPDCLNKRIPKFQSEHQNEPFELKCFQCGQRDDPSGAYALKRMNNGEYLCPRCLMTEGYRRRSP